jgi:hypothetical protein
MRFHTVCKNYGKQESLHGGADFGKITSLTALDAALSGQGG